MKQIDGIELRGNKIRIHFTYQNYRYRETLNIEPTKTNLKQAKLIRSEILLKIQRGIFNYADYFPNSKNVNKFKNVVITNQNYNCEILLNKLLNDYSQMVKNNYMSPSTYNGYRKLINGLLIPYFKLFDIREITPIIIREWIEGINATAKTIRNALTPLRAMFDDALNDQIIDNSPLLKLAIDKLLRVNAQKSEYIINPFTELEKNIIINAAHGQIRNLIQFCFWTGLRISELIALQWDMVNLNKKTIHIKRAKVVGILKEQTKTASGTRDVFLFPLALEALIEQKKYTKDNSIFVFHNPNTNKAWANSNKVADAWRKVIANTNIQYRNPYQMRHTYASTLLSNGEKPLLVAKQMGHIDVQMIFTVYGKWIPKEEDNSHGFIGDYNKKFNL